LAPDRLPPTTLKVKTWRVLAGLASSAAEGIGMTAT
jgi:hypothetical protein